MATTTRPIPAAMIFSVQGGVRPVDCTVPASHRASPPLPLGPPRCSDDFRMGLPALVTFGIRLSNHPARL